MELSNPKHTDHHFKKMSEYKYTLEFVEPRKSYEELQKENRALKLAFQVLKTASELFSNVQKLGATFPQNKTICPKCRSKKIAISEFWKESLCVDCDYRWEW
jgi:hypothetical protein